MSGLNYLPDERGVDTHPSTAGSMDITSVWLVSVTFVQRMRRQGVCAFHESVFCISEVVVYSTVSCKLEKVQNWQDIMR